MCGLAGATDFCGHDLVVQATNRLRHRGPDFGAVWQQGDGHAVLGHRRLMTTDPSPAAHQPLISSDQRYVLIFNGYLAGHRALMADMRTAGKGGLRSGSDAELFLAVWQQGGLAAIAALSGPYAFAIWDRTERRLTLGIDPMGIKPLYVAVRTDGHLRFASELLAVPGLADHEIAPDRLFVSYMAHLFVPAPLTPFVGVRQLRPGEILQWCDGKVTTARIDEMSGTDWADIAGLSGAVENAVAGALDADCPVACLVSGGMDSAGVAALACKVARRSGRDLPVGLVMGFPGSKADETARAQSLTAHLGMALKIIDAPMQAEDLLGRLQAGLRAFGAPFGNPAIILHHMLSEHVAKIAPVCLTGDGGDELFGGYPRYQAARLIPYALHLPGWMRRMAAQVAGDGNGHVARFLNGIRQDATGAFAHWNNRCGIAELSAALLGDDMPDGLLPGELATAMMNFDRRVTLPGNQLAMSDRCGMAFGVEYRPPLLDRAVGEMARSVPAQNHLRRGGKALWREVVGPMVPKGYLAAGKTGFNPPVGDWLMQICPLLWGDQILDGLFEDLPVSQARRQDLWHRATQQQGFNAGLSLWALMAWRVWRRDHTPA
ncbi:MAG: asparagine synthase-related protein [Pseudomonadota bacterium]